jgi:hypothetical protein
MRELIALVGPVQCEQPAGAVNLVLRGHLNAPPAAVQGALPGAPSSAILDASAGPTEVLFSDATPVTLPAGLHDVRVFELLEATEFGAAPSAAPPPAWADADVARHFRLQGPQLLLEWHARSVQLHRDAAAAFYRALPPPRVPLRLRWGWSLLLAALRLPGAVTLIRKLRGAA